MNKTTQQINQYLLSRGDAAEPCYHCVSKILRTNKMEIEKMSKENDRQILTPNIITIQQNYDRDKTQPFLYLDKDRRATNE